MVYLGLAFLKMVIFLGKLLVIPLKSTKYGIPLFSDFVGFIFSGCRDFDRILLLDSTGIRKVSHCPAVLLFFQKNL